MSLTGIVSVDIEALRYLSDEDIFKYCEIKSHNIRRVCNDPSLWRLRILDRYRHLSDYPNASDEEVLQNLVGKYYPGEGFTGKLFWRKYYKFLVDISGNLTLTFLRFILDPHKTPYKFLVIKYMYDMKKKPYTDITGYNFIDRPTPEIQNRMNQYAEQRQPGLEIPIFLKPEISMIVNREILPFITDPRRIRFEQIRDVFLIYIYGLTSLDALEWLISWWVNQKYRLAPDYWRETMLLVDDDDFNFLVDDAAIPLDQLTLLQHDLLHTPNIRQRVEDEHNLLMNNRRF